jgi:hypothetical protein
LDFWTPWTSKPPKKIKFQHRKIERKLYFLYEKVKKYIFDNLGLSSFDCLLRNLRTFYSHLFLFILIFLVSFENSWFSRSQTKSNRLNKNRPKIYVNFYNYVSILRINVEMFLLSYTFSLLLVAFWWELNKKVFGPDKPLHHIRVDNYQRSHQGLWIFEIMGLWEKLYERRGFVRIAPKRESARSQFRRL